MGQLIPTKEDPTCSADVVGSQRATSWVESTKMRKAAAAELVEEPLLIPICELHAFAARLCEECLSLWRKKTIEQDETEEQSSLKTSHARQVLQRLAGRFPDPNWDPICWHARFCVPTCASPDKCAR